MIGYQFLIEVDVTDQAGVASTLRFCCQPGFTGGGYTWRACIIDPGLFKVSLFSGGKTTGVSTYSYGEVVLNNFKTWSAAVGPLDTMSQQRFYGRQIRMYYGLKEAAFPSGFTRAYTAVVSDIKVDWDTVRLSLKGRQYELDLPFDESKFLGNNVSPNGYEGDISLLDRVKPCLIGRCTQVPVVLCNSAKLIYAVSTVTGISVDGMNSNLVVKDNGVRLHFQAISTDLVNDPPDPGCFKASISGYIRLGSTPAGQVTCDVVQQGYALTAKPANLISYILNRKSLSSMIDATSFAAHAAVDGYERGIYLNSITNSSKIIDELLAPIGYWYFDPSGKMKLDILKDPATMTPVYAFSGTTNISSFQNRKSLDTKGGAPASKVTINYRKNYSVNKNPATSVSAADKALMAQDYSTVSIDAPPANIQPISEEMIVTSSCYNSNTLHQNLLSIFYCAEREIVDISVLPAMFLATVNLLPGTCVSLDLNGRFGYTVKPMLVISTTINYADESVKLTLWG